MGSGRARRPRPRSWSDARAAPTKPCRSRSPPPAGAPAEESLQETFLLVRSRGRAAAGLDESASSAYAAADRSLRGLALLCSAHLVAPVRDPVDAEGECAEYQDEVGHLREDLPGEHRPWLARHLQRKAEVGERDAREHQNRGAASLLDPVDVIDVAAGLLRDAPARLADQVVAPAEERRARGADARAGRRLSLLEAGRAQDALAHDRHRPVPLVLGDAEGTGHDAVAAADALVGVVDDGAGAGLLERADRADGSARRHETVQAHPADVDAALLLDRRPRVGRRRGLDRRGEIVLLLARRRAGLAPDALRRIDEQAPGHGFLPSPVAVRGAVLAGPAGAGSSRPTWQLLQALSSWTPKDLRPS